MGRPRSRLPDEVIKRLGPCPADPLARQHWVHAMLGEIVGLQAIGEIDSGLAAELRASISAMVRAIPMQVLIDVDERMQADEEAVEADDRGPQMEPIDGEAPA